MANKNNKFSDLLLQVQNTQIRSALERMFAIAGLAKTSTENAPGLTLTGDVTGDLTGAVTGTTVTSTTLTTTTATPVNAVGSAAKITSSGEAVPAVHAVSVLTNDTTDIDDGKVITIDATVYRFKTTPAQAYDVLRGTSAANSIANLAAAINASGTGDGTDYFAGTLAHPTAYASASDATTCTVQIRIPGSESNADVTESDDAGWTWTGADFANGTVAGVTSAAATFTIGTRTYMFVNELSETNAVAIVDQVLYGANAAAALDNMKVALNAGATEGTNYSTGTVVNADVTAGTNTNTTQVITAKVKGVAGDLIASTETMANFVWDDVTLGTEVAGVDGTVGVKGEIRWDTTNIYLCILANTISDANWTQATMATF